MEFESWDDPRFLQESAFMNQWYRARLGYRDIIRMIRKPPELIPIHTWEEAKGRFNTRLCSREDHGHCPWCEFLQAHPTHKYVKQWAAVILHLFRGPKGQKSSYVGQLLAWRFGDDKKRQLLEAHEVSGRRIFKIDLSVAVMDGQDTEKMQKLIILPHPESVLDKLKPEVKKQLESLVAKKFEEMRKLFHPTPEELAQGVKGEREATKFDFGGAGEFEPAIDDDKEVGEKETNPKKGRPTGKKEEKSSDDVPFEGEDPLADLDLPESDGASGEALNPKKDRSGSEDPRIHWRGKEGVAF